MKKSNLLFTGLIIAAISIFTACENSSHKMERADNTAMMSDRDMDMTESEGLAEVQMFRFKISNEIKANFRRIAAIQDTINTRDEDLRENYKAKLEVLDDTNRQIKRTIDNFHESGRDQWTVFKDEFRDSMDGLAYSLDNFFAANSANSINN